MLVALRKNGEYVSLAEKWSREGLIQLRKTESFSCPACQNHVHLKIGTKKITHFAHMKGAECSVKTEAESEYHLQGKEKLFHWFKDQQIDVELEPYLKEISQRPDLLVTMQGQPYAIEFQCSQIDHEQFSKRTASYKRIGIQPIWIVGAKWFQRKSADSISLSQFQWFFATTLAHQKIPRLLYFCPQSSQFVIASNLLPFHSSSTFSKIQFFRKNNLSFKHLLFHQQTKVIPEDFWINKKYKWRTTITSFPTGKLSHFLQSLYEKRIPPSYLPAEAGLPVPSMYCFNTPAIIWQMWLLLDLIIPLKNGELFSYRLALTALSKRISSKDIALRQLPLISTTNYSVAIYEYLQVLTELQILQRDDKKMYKKINELTIPTTLQEAFLHDKTIIQRIKTGPMGESLQG